MPLFQFGAINTGRYKAGALPQSTNLFSWPMNNYWVTNFNADQRGGHAWSYFITSSGDSSDRFATTFGWNSRVPLLSRILPGEGTGDNNVSGSFINGWPENLLLVSTKPLEEKNTILVHVRELSGKECRLDLTDGLTGNKLKIIAVDVNGMPLNNSDNIIMPYESEFFKVSSLK